MLSDASVRSVQDLTQAAEKPPYLNIELSSLLQLLRHTVLTTVNTRCIYAHAQETTHASRRNVRFGAVAGQGRGDRSDAFGVDTEAV